MDLKERCREVMVKHLEAKGYPNMTRRQILRELKPMWIALENAGLTPELKAAGYSFESFSNSAMSKAQEAAFEEFVQKQINRTMGIKK